MEGLHLSAGEWTDPSSLLLHLHAPGKPTLVWSPCHQMVLPACLGPSGYNPLVHCDARCRHPRRHRSRHQHPYILLGSLGNSCLWHHHWQPPQPDDCNHSKCKQNRLLCHRIHPQCTLCLWIGEVLAKSRWNANWWEKESSMTETHRKNSLFILVMNGK